MPSPASSFILRPSSFSSAFSLVEVVLAIGIVSFALLTILGLFGGIMKSSGDNVQRREMAETVDSLRSFLNRTNFDTAYDWVRTNREFLYVSYLVGSGGAPDKNSQTVAGLWTNADASGLEAYDEARSGGWIRARLGVSPSNPGGTNLPAAAGSYARASLFVLADIAPVPTPAGTNASRLQSTIVINR